ncbi:OmpA family protein [Daejeonella sp.]|uniref:OmpA family protein n=1 Tax=Daejeonella sp. TaxID=2805397 RepID=UPI003982E865
MFFKIKIIQKVIICSMMIILAHGTAQGQSSPWWFGASGAANLNFYDGTTQRLNNSLFVPTAFHRGFGIKPYGSLFLEYRPGPIWGAILNVGYDGRGADFNNVIAPCNCPATLESNLSYLSVEPSLRMGSATSNFFFFAGPRVAFNRDNSFEYTQLKQPNTDAEFSAVRKTVITGQIGVGYDFIISSPAKEAKVALSPFLSFHPDFGQNPRTIESLSISTLRMGVALKFGKGKVAEIAPTPIAITTVAPEITFSIRPPLIASVKRQVSETLPLRNYVFFDEGSSAIPNRYITLSRDQANNFREAQLQNVQTESMSGRSGRQLNVYHNILNITGDRLRSNPGATISLSGASMTGPEEGKQFAENIKNYLVNTFGIDGSRISTMGRTKPLIPSEQPGGTRELVLLRAGDRRVDIESASPELLMEVGGGMMKPVAIEAMQSNPDDANVIFNIGGASNQLKSWTVDVTDETGRNQRYGPFTGNSSSIPGKTILGDRTEGNYKVSMNGETISGLPINKTSTFRVVRQEDTIEKAFRYSILFDFDQTRTIESYARFLRDVVSPQIPDGASVIIHGHTDVIGETEYNNILSQGRAAEALRILQSALTSAGKNNVKFETSGFGEDESKSPFDNITPEERFYNRTVIIDIVPNR